LARCSGLALCNVVLAIIAAIRARFHPFFVLIVVATAFGLIAGLSVGPIGKAFGNGFSDALYSPGLVIVGMALVAGIAERAVAAGNLAAVTSRLGLNGGWVQAAVGLIAGIGASPAAALALLTPLLPSAEAKPSRERDATCLTLAISAGHGLIYLSPVPVAAAAILGASWQHVALFGAPVALICAAIGIGWVRLVAAPHIPIQPTISDPSGTKAKPDGKAAALLLAACFIPLLMLMTQSIATCRANRSAAA
jgi:GntP family gluconate:H+ symporter